MAVPSLVIVSSQFKPEAAIPSAHTCEGADRSPALHWSGVPARARTLALIVDDPDAPDPKAPKMTWVHWVLYNMPASTASLPEGMTRVNLPPGTKEALNDWKRPGWRGPCPPIGRHRYFFKLYALDTVLPDLGPSADKPALEKAMQGHILAEGRMFGTYEKQPR